MDQRDLISTQPVTVLILFFFYIIFLCHDLRLISSLCAQLQLTFWSAIQFFNFILNFSHRHVCIYTLFAVGFDGKLLITTNIYVYLHKVKTILIKWKFFLFFFLLSRNFFILHNTFMHNVRWFLYLISLFLRCFQS